MIERTENGPDGLVNFRDLGGLPVAEGVTTNPGVLYRSDAPYAGDRAPDDVGQWPPKAVIDLRDTVGEAGPEHPMEAVTRVYRVPLLEGVREKGEGSALSLGQLYAAILDHAPKRLLEVFRIAVETDGPVLVHCAAGKDRTGVSCALLLSAAGVRYDSIVGDYVHTDRNMYRVLQRLRVVPELPPGVDEESVKELISAPAEAIEHVLTRLDEHDDGAVGWLREHGVAEDEIDSWRTRFVAADE